MHKSSDSRFPQNALFAASAGGVLYRPREFMSTVLASHTTAGPFASHKAASAGAYRRDIDGLRAVAVLAVLGYHAFPRWLPGGFIGVDVFFVIYGYLITQVLTSALQRGDFSLVDFYVRRIRRIFPALAVVLLACLAFGWKYMLADDLAQLARHLMGGVAFVSNLVLWNEAGYFDATSESKPLLHLWSLGIEEQFYLLWPLLVAWAWRKGHSIGRITLGLALLSFACNLGTLASHPTAAFYSPLSRAWELLIGAALNWRVPAPMAAIPRRWMRDLASVAGTCLIGVAMWKLEPASRFPGWWALAPTVGTALLIWAGPGAAVNRLLLARRAIVAIGLVSFPLYLWHWPLLTLGQDLVAPGPAGRLGLLLASGVLAVATLWLVEKPLRFGPAGRKKALGLLVLMAAIGIVALWVKQEQGVPERYPQIVRNATDYDLDGFRTGMRWKRCFLEFEQEAPDYAPDCVDAGPLPLVAIWGDSGAAALYPGFRALAMRSGSFRLAQFTSSACPPLVGFHSDRRPACADNNRRALERLREARPWVVVLAALWQYYDPARLASTIAELRAQGVPRVIVLGPGLTWEEAPARILLKAWQKDPLHRMPPARMDYSKHEGLQSGDIRWMPAVESEARIRRIATDYGAQFVSVQQALCDPSGCLMRASADSGESFFLDTAHLNPAGSRFVIDALEGELGLNKPFVR